MEQQLSRESENLRMLSIFHYIAGGIGCVFSLFPLMHVGMGIFMLMSPETLSNNGDGQAPPELFAWMFIIMGSLFIIIGEITSIMVILSGRFISKRKNYTFSFVIACIECLSVPFGTILGVFTIVNLLNDSVKEMYKAEKEV